MGPRLSKRSGIVLVILSFNCAHEAMAESNLNLSIPQDILTNKSNSLPKQDSLTNPEEQEIQRSPKQMFYVQNANEKILRRLKAVPAQDQFGKQICGKIEYRAKVRPNGELEVVEVIPVKQKGKYERKVAVYLEQNQSLRDSKEVSRMETFTSDDDEINIFVNAMIEAIHAAAPFPQYQDDANISQMSGTQRTIKRFNLIYGTFWRECHSWTPPTRINPQ